MTTPTPLSTESYRHKKVLEGFSEFIARGNVIDMAVGVVMGNAVTAIVKSLVKNFLNPLIAMIFGKPDMSGLLQVHVNGATISFGAILNDILNFLLIAVAVYFCVIVPINKFRDFTDKAKTSSTVEKIKFWKHAKKGSPLDKAVKPEKKIADKVGLPTSSSNDTDDVNATTENNKSDKSAASASETPKDGNKPSQGSVDATSRDEMLALLAEINDKLSRIADQSANASAKPKE